MSEIQAVHGDGVMSVNLAACPVCGLRLKDDLSTASREISSNCPRCRTQLNVAMPDHLPILLVGVVLAVTISFALNLHGLMLILAIAGSALAFVAVGEFLRGILANPRLERYNPKLGPTPLSKNVRPAR